MPNTEIQIEIEKSCLLTCRHCSSTRHDSIPSTSQSRRHLIEFVKKIPNNVYLSMSGGEPLLNKDIFEIANDLSRSRTNLNIGIFTSGLINENNTTAHVPLEMAVRLKDSGINYSYVSVYHKYEKLHDYITNRPSSFKKTLNTINNFLHVGIDTKVHLVVNKINVEALQDIIQFLGSLGVTEVRLLRLVRTGRAITNWESIGCSTEQLTSSIVNIYNIKDKFPLQITFSGIPELTACRPFKDSIKCQAGIQLFYIDFSGNIFPCACTRNIRDLKIANISELSAFEDYYNSDKNLHNERCLNVSP